VEKRSREVIEPIIELQVDAFLPDPYVVDSQTKASLYQRLALVRDEEQLSEMVDELVDRFGTPPREVEHLIEIIRIKLLASSLKVEQIQQAKQTICHSVWGRYRFHNGRISNGRGRGFYLSGVF